MAMDVTVTKGFLLNSCRDWDITDGYGGDRYRRSSVMGLNRPVDDDGRTLTGTVFDISDPGMFHDWMESRAAQANALLSDINRLSRIRAMSETAMSDADMDYVSRNFGERAVMALYGVDESKFGKAFTKYEAASGERPYKETCAVVADRVSVGDGDYMAGLKARLYSFAKDWRDVSAEEKTRAAICREDRTEPMCVVRVLGQDAVMPVYSADYLAMYMSEYNGHAGYFGRMRGVPENDIPYASAERGIKLFGSERKPFSQMDTVLASEWASAQDGLKRLDASVRAPADPDLSRDQGHYGLDGAGLSASADVDRGRYSRQVEYGGDMRVRREHEAAWQSRRDTSDLDAAAEAIAGCNAPETEASFPDFGL